MSTSGGLATAFYRLYILHGLEQPARPAALLAALHAREGALPLPSGGFSRAVQQLLDTGLIAAAPAGALQLTAFGRREREAQRIVWERLVGIVGRLLAGELPAPEPPPSGGVPLAIPSGERVADGYRERVVVAELREAIRRAREGGEPPALVLALIAVAHAQPVRAKAMLHRALRETLGSARSTFGGHVIALRYGTHGVALLGPERSAEAQAELLRARLSESLAAMTATVHTFAGARHAVRVGVGRWTPAVLTSAQLLRLAEDALVDDGQTRSAA